MKTNQIKNLVDNAVIENPLCTCLFEGRKCWKGIIVASVLGYNTPARAINRFLKARDLVKEVDYDILEGSRLKEFKKQVVSQVGDGGLKASKVIIFYESAVYEFMFYSEKESAKEFQEVLKNRETFNSEKFVLEAKVQEVLESELKDKKREKEFERLNQISRMIGNLYIIDDNSKAAEESKDNFIWIANYLIDKLQN